MEDDDGEPFDEKMKRLTSLLKEQMSEASKLDSDILRSMTELGYGN